MKKKIVTMLLILTCITSALLSGCTTTVINPDASDSTSIIDIPPTAAPYEPVWLIAPTQTEEDQNVSEAYLSLTANLARMNYQPNTNMMISPASIEFALGMTLAGAEGETLAQMNRILGNTASREEILDFCRTYQNSLNEEEDSPFHVANSIWINKKIIKGSLKKTYTSTLDDVFNAESYTENFTNSTKNKINNWCSKNTNKMIPELLTEINPEAASYLINTICFEEEWVEPYEEWQIKEDIFHNEDETQTNAEFLHETLGFYYETDNACGFSKYYKGYKYAFVAVLPDEEVGLETYMENFSAKEYQDFMESETTKYDVRTKLPKFKNDYSVNLNNQLQMLGMTDAFTPAADFSGIIDKSQNELYISNVIHKTHIDLDECGTKAAAATLIEMRNATCAVTEEKQEREVYLDRPFLYMIVDMDTQMPIFIGTVNCL